MTIHRRTFLVAASAALAAKPFSKPIGVQLCTARTVLPKDPEGTLKKIAGIGYKEVELYNYDQFQKLLPIVNGLGMKATSAHMSMPLITGDWGSQPPIAMADFLGAAKSGGVRYVGMPYLAPKDRRDYGALCQKMNKAGEECKKAGLQSFYHNHAFEFAGAAGTRVIDTFAKELDKKLVKLELDVFWVSAAGVDPVEVLRECKGRVALLHVKDKERGMPVITTESQAKPSNFKEVGAGSLDMPKILAAAISTGVDRFYVEQDQTPGDPIESLRISYENLQKMSL
jgi:sugar phosphate isomerase/epimerase